MIRRVLLASLLVLVGAGAANAQPTVFLVRHAERADGGKPADGGMMAADPDLSAAGRARAVSLATVLQDAKISAIFTTELKRTIQTAEPLAKALGLPIVQVPGKDLAGLVKKISAASGNVLVVGHSNTVPEALTLLGVNETVTIGDEDFDNLFVVTAGSSPSLVRLRYR
jgi:broad specificity phosphatase PhoE